MQGQTLNMDLSVGIQLCEILTLLASNSGFHPGC